MGIKWVLHACTVSLILIITGCDSGGSSGTEQNSASNGGSGNSDQSSGSSCKAFNLDEIPTYRTVQTAVDLNTNQLDEEKFELESAFQETQFFSYMAEFNGFRPFNVPEVPLAESFLFFGKVSNAETISREQIEFEPPLSLEEAVAEINKQQKNAVLGFPLQPYSDGLVHEASFIKVKNFCSPLESRVTRVNTIRLADNSVDANSTMENIVAELNQLGKNGELLTGHIDKITDEFTQNATNPPVKQYQIVTTKSSEQKSVTYDYQIRNQPFAGSDFVDQLNELGEEGFYPIDSISTFHAYGSNAIDKTTTIYTVFARSSAQPDAKFSFRLDDTPYSSANELYDILNNQATEGYRTFQLDRTYPYWIFTKPVNCEDVTYCILNFGYPTY